ncbi:M23 family metallopeptidase [Streptomyces sp. NPDC004647]|uniref:M23 family metallopeptidase n=1 Tax=Streptomyces sp. NPDC004647 TaxID=3154671 RepID=UPI0033BDBFBD
MASNSPAPEFLYEPESHDAGFAEEPPAGVGDWNPTAESVAAVRGRHRVVKQRGGGMARSSAVLGVGVFAAVGAGGMASAQEKPPVSISMPDLASVSEKLPDAGSLPGIGSLVSDDSGSGSDGAGEGVVAAQAPLSQAGLTDSEVTDGTGAGEALRARIMKQAEQQQSAAEKAEREAEEKAAAEKAAKVAAEKKAAAKAAAEKAEAEAERKAKAAAEAERLAKLAREYTAPVSSYTLTSSFGQSGSMWSNDHTGQDLAAPTGTPVKAVHGGTITEAGWAGSYGYRIVLTLEDGTEVWFCHLSSMTQTSGKVATGETIGRVGATGNVTGAHLHMEVRPGGGDPIDPAAWLREHGVSL